MHEHDHDHGAGTVGVKATEKRASCNRFRDVCDRCVRVIRGRDIVESEKHAGDHLRNE